MKKTRRKVGRRIRRGWYKNKTVNQLTREEIYPTIIDDWLFKMTPMQIWMTYDKHNLLDIPKGYRREFIIRMRFRVYNKNYRKHLIRKGRLKTIR